MAGGGSMSQTTMQVATAERLKNWERADKRSDFLAMACPSDMASELGCPSNWEIYFLTSGEHQGAFVVDVSSGEFSDWLDMNEEFKEPLRCFCFDTFASAVMACRAVEESFWEIEDDCERS
jgi:hypothetical protein